MKKYSAASIRNTCLLSHGGVGKTTLMEAISYTSKATNKFNKISNGTSNFDTRADEKERKMTICLKLGAFEWNDTKVNIIDTPGFLDLQGEARAALRVVDSAIILVSAVDGVQVGTELMNRFVEETNTPKLFFINGIDKENVNFDKVLNSLKETYGTNIVPVTIPIGSSANFKGIINLITKEAFEYVKDGNGIGKKIEIPAELKEQVDSLNASLIESIAETDEELMNKYFEKGELAQEEIKKGLIKSISEKAIFPVLCGSAFYNIGIDNLLNFIVDFCPSALSRKEEDILEGDEKKKIQISEDMPFSALVFKTISEEHIGDFNCIRVFSGKLVNGKEFINVTRNSTEKAGNMYFLRGHERIDTDEISFGDIGAILKLKDTHTNDTIADKGVNYKFLPINFPEPLVSIAIQSKNKGDEDKIGMGFAKIREEDLTFSYKYHSDIKQSILSAMGDVHIDIILGILKNRFKVDVEKKQPKISYRETITKSVKYIEYTHKKQSGGAGQYAKVAIDLEPLPRGKGYEFVDKIVGGVIDQPFRPSVDKGIRAKMEEGIIAGYPIVDVRVYLVDGKTHPVDSKDIAFQIAGREAFKLAFEQAGPILLEPIVDMMITVPEEYTGDVMGDLSSRRGKIGGIKPEGKLQTIVAKVPESEIQNYPQSLRAITQGRGYFTKSFSHYEQVPSELAKKIIEASKQKEEQ
jgi:elongation factor G